MIRVNIIIVCDRCGDAVVDNTSREFHFDASVEAARQNAKRFGWGDHRELCGDYCPACAGKAANDKPDQTT